MTVHASCHCGGTRMKVTVPPVEITECNCTFCYKRGGLWAYYDPDQVVVVDAHSVPYTSDPLICVHYHCGVCGCSTHSRSAGTWTDDGLDTRRPRVTVNARLFEDLDVGALPVVRLDGRNEW